MPIYEYQCDKCGHQLDALQKLSEPVLVTCPACQADSLRRLISAPQFRLKGSGWYETDFKKDKRRNLADGADKPGVAANADGDAAKGAQASAGQGAVSDSPASKAVAAADKTAGTSGGKKTVKKAEK